MCCAVLSVCWHARLGTSYSVLRQLLLFDGVLKSPTHADNARVLYMLPQCPSFLHMHLGIDATGLSPGLDCHHLVVNDWNSLTEPLNVCIASIPTQFDQSLAPAGENH